MNRLAKKMARAIEADGPLSIAAFATMALHDRDDGFYAAHESIGAHGAFITAPEISQIFGELLGLWCAQAWRDQGSPNRARLVELGPGRGTLMKDMVHALHVAPDFLAAIDIVLVEESAVLRTLQRQRLEGTPLPIRWVRQWTEIMADRPLYVLANEFLDALPIRQFVKTDRGWCERMVTVNEAGNLNFALAPDPTPIAPAAERGHEQAGVVYEISPAAQALAEEVSGAIAAQGGAALFIDYGHDGSGFGDTLQAVRRHTPADVLQAPGEADLSAHVDFAALARAASTAPVRVYGPISQGDFLQGLGIEARGAALMRKNPAAAAEVAQAVERLTAASRMGTLFKALAIGPRDQPPLPGF